MFAVPVGLWVLLFYLGFVICFMGFVDVVGFLDFVVSCVLDCFYFVCLRDFGVLCVLGFCVILFWVFDLGVCFRILGVL